MTVKELIKCLLNYPENTEVFLMEEVKLKRQEKLAQYYQPLSECMLLYEHKPLEENKPYELHINCTDYSELMKKR